ncbi:MAG: hypothetical protein HW413_1035 [Thermoleophilia bacterium]|nr:hypothetical protein [Thermoleophilia bacterium]
MSVRTRAHGGNGAPLPGSPHRPAEKVQRYLLCPPGPVSGSEALEFLGHRHRMLDLARCDEHMTEPGQRLPRVELRRAGLPANGQALLQGEPRGLVLSKIVVRPAELFEGQRLSGRVAQLAPHAESLLEVGQRLVLVDEIESAEMREHSGSNSIARLVSPEHCGEPVACLRHSPSQLPV